MRPPSQPPRPVVVTRDETLRDLLATLARAERVAVDIEASGMFAYRAEPCTVQLAWDGGQAVAVVDVLATPVKALAPLLGVEGPVKIVHDVAFDARLLAESGVTLGNVHDTSVAARMLSRQATGLASLLDAELGIKISKTLQQHDWRERPLDESMLAYLAADVAHLEALDRKLWSELEAHDIEEAVLEETRYRLASAAEAASDPAPAPPPYARVKGAHRLSERELAALRAIAEVREQEARRRDVPPHQVASADALLAIARARPTSVDALARLRGAATPEGREFATALLRALAGAGDHIPEDERAHFEPARIPAEEAKRRREREARLTAWRRAEAKRRGVDEQVVLPGHCLKDAASPHVRSPADLARVPGIGAFRIARDGEAMATALFAAGVEATA
ncbi:MAG TPA: ribonuclease D [Polyangiaceae bacterium]|jgi:ribonuclease D|nr:ribonuclease D [Polyangiaceae bacterium]